MVLKAQSKIRQVWHSKVGPPETLVVKQADLPQPLRGQVRIAVRAAGINFADVLTRIGIYPDAPKLPTVMGYEVSGTVDAVGEGVTRFQTGDRVLALCRFGGYSESVVLPEAQVFAIPEGMSFEAAATIPVNYLTAYQMLFVMGSLRAGDKVLVHSCAGGVGLAALELCRIADAEVIATASLGKHSFLKERGVPLVIDSVNGNIEGEVRRWTNGRGVQIVLDPVGGDSWKTSLACLSATGRLVCFGIAGAAVSKKRNLRAAFKLFVSTPWFKINPMMLMNENKAVIGVNLGHLWNEIPMMSGWMEQILTWAREKKITPHVDRTFPFEKAAEAHHYIQDRKNIGKVLLVP